MRPGLDGTSSLYPLSSIRCKCRGPAQRHWQPPKYLVLTQPKGSGSLEMKRKTLVLILRSALVARLHSYSDPSEDHPRRNCWHLSHSTMVQPNRTASCAYPPDCHGMTSLPLLRPPLATSTPPLLPSLCSNSKAYL